MARTKTKGLHPSFGPLVTWMGKKEAARQLIEEVGIKPVVEELGVKSLIEEVGLASLFDALTPAQREELMRLQEQATHARNRSEKE